MFKSKLIAGAVLAALLGTAHAGATFKVEESAISGTPSNEISADKITLRYEAQINQTQANPAAQTVFNESGFFNATGFSLGSSSQSTFLNGPGVSGYKIYGLFTVSGSISFIGTTALADFLTGSVQFFADVNSDTTKALNGSNGLGATTLGANGDDILLGSSNVVLAGSQANVPLVGNQAASGGSFVINYGALDLTATGAAFFFDPQPFYLRIEVSGENESFNPALTPGNYSGVAVGDASAEFNNNVPEPASLALVGAALLGLGLARRRSNKA